MIICLTFCTNNNIFISFQEIYYKANLKKKPSYLSIFYNFAPNNAFSFDKILHGFMKIVLQYPNFSFKGIVHVLLFYY